MFRDDASGFGDFYEPGTHREGIIYLERVLVHMPKHCPRGSVSIACTDATGIDRTEKYSQSSVAERQHSEDGRSSPTIY